MIIGFSAKKQGGKDSAFDYVSKLYPYSLKHPKSFHFATPLKDFCIEYLGLDYDSVYGTNKQKDAPTHLLWENFPLPAYKLASGKIVIAKNGFYDIMEASLKDYSTRPAYDLFQIEKQPERLSGPMTGRQVQQYWATDLIRHQYPDSFLNKAFNDIDCYLEHYPNRDCYLLDVRFPNEVAEIQRRGGKVLRFARDLYGDQHESETALDQHNFNNNLFDGIIYNQTCSLEEKNKQVVYYLAKWGVV